MAESDLIRGNVDTIILKVLYDGDRYGYDLIKQINARSDGQWEIKQPTVYACLKRLEKQGFISSYWDSSESDGGRRKYYSLTESGREVFLKYKNEFERASSLFGGIISGGEPTVFIHPTDDYSDVEEEGYSLPKRKPVRKPPQKKEKPSQEQQTIQPVVEQPPVVEQAQPTPPPVVEPIQSAQAPVQEETPVVPAQPEQQDKPEQPMREALDPKLIIEQYFAEQRGESYSDIQRKNNFAVDTSAEQPVQPTAPAQPVQQAKPVQPEKSVQPVQPTAPVKAENQENPVQPVKPTLPTPTAERPMLVPAAMKGFESTPAPIVEHALQEEESPARREYKTVLEELVDRFEVSSPDVRTERATAAAEQAATAEQAENRHLTKVEQAVRELGNDVKIRNHNNSAKEYAGKNYYYSNRLMMTHYTIMCVAMFLIGLIMFLTFYAGLNMRMQYDYVLYICAGLLPIIMFIIAVICFANNADKTKRINVNFKFSIIIRIVIMIQVAVVIYCVNLIWGMPLAFSEYYVPSLVLPLAYALFIPISEIIFMNLLKSGNYSDNKQ